MTQTLVQTARVVAVVALLCAAAAIASPRGRLPLALRGIRRMMRHDAGMPQSAPEGDGSVSAVRRAAAFALVVLAGVVAILHDIW